MATLGSRRVGFGVSKGADINSCSEFTSQLIQKSEMSTDANLPSSQTMTNNSTVVVT